MESFMDTFNPNQRVPASMKRRTYSGTTGTAFPGVPDKATALAIVAGVTADPVFDLPIHADGTRRTAVQSWWAAGQLKFRLRPESNANMGMVLDKAAKVKAAIDKGDGGDDGKGER